MTFIVFYKMPMKKKEKVPTSLFFVFVHECFVLFLYAIKQT